MPDGINESGDREERVPRSGARGLLVFTEGHADHVTTEQTLLEATGSEPRLSPGKASP